MARPRRDGQLDLIVLHYARWPAEVGLAQAFTIADIGRSYGAPSGFSSSFPSVYRNLGQGHFALLPESYGLRDIDTDTGRPVAQPLSIVPLDANGDGRIDVLITYQNSPPALFLAQPSGPFVKQGARPGNRNEGAAASLVSASALTPGAERATDLRGPILIRIAAGSTRANEDLPLDLAAKLGVAIADFNLDGRAEGFSGQGAAELRLNRFEAGRDFARKPAVLYSKGGYWTASATPETEPWAMPLRARGIAFADFDGDGDLDVVIAQNDGSPLLLRNDQRQGWPWLRLQLSATRSQREAFGARVEVHTPRRVFAQTVLPAMGFMAQSESTLTFGLGEDARVRKIVIHWPSGQVQELQPEALNRTLQIREP